MNRSEEERKMRRKGIRLRWKGRVMERGGGREAAGNSAEGVKDRGRLINIVSDLAKSPIASTAKTGPADGRGHNSPQHPCARAAAANAAA